MKEDFTDIDCEMKEPDNRKTLRKILKMFLKPFQILIKLIENLSSIGPVTMVVSVLAIGIPVSILILGVYIPYDVFLGNDELEFVEHSPIIVSSFGISLIPLGIGMLETLITKEYKVIKYLILLYAIPVVLLVAGCIEEEEIISALLAFIPAFILFIFPAIVFFILAGIAYGISSIFGGIDFLKGIVKCTFILAFVISIALSVISGIRLGNMP